MVTIVDFIVLGDSGGNEAINSPYHLQCSCGHRESLHGHPVSDPY